MKPFLPFIGLCIAMLGLPPLATAAPPADKEAACDQALLSAVGSLADAHLQQARQTLEVLARTEEVRSGQWERMKRLVGSSVPKTLAQALWFTLPDGTYYTSAEGLAGQKLADRPYFPKLIAGETVCGDLVVSKSTGKKSVIIAVPVTHEDRVMGALGASIFVDDLSQLLNAQLKLPDGCLFYALTTSGMTAFHINPSLDFVDPRQLQNPSLSDAVKTILDQTTGEVTYEFNGSPRHVIFNTSPLTGWRVAFGRVLPKERE